MPTILDVILDRASKEKRRIGIGISPQNIGHASNYYKLATNYAEVIPASSYEELLGLLYENKIEGIVRGQLDFSYRLFNELSTKYNFRKDFRVSLIRDVSGRIFFFGPTSIRWNNSYEDKIEYVLRVINHIKDFGIEEKNIKIAVLLPMHQNDISDLKIMGKKLDEDSILQLRFLEKASAENEKLIKNLNLRGLNALNYDNQIERALKDNATFIVPYNGIIGNAISRALWLVDHRETEDKARLLSLQLLTENYYDWVIENTASSEKDFSYHIISAVAWLNKKINNI